MITEKEYLQAKSIVDAYNIQENEENLSLEQQIEQSKALEDIERLQQLNELAQNLANQFTSDMHTLEEAIQEALDEVSEEAMEETGWYSLEDVTQDINVTNSFDY